MFHVGQLHGEFAPIDFARERFRYVLNDRLGRDAFASVVDQYCDVLIHTLACFRSRPGSNIEALGRCRTPRDSRQFGTE